MSRIEHGEKYNPYPMRKVIIIDQFTGPSPYQLQQTPMPYRELQERLELGQYVARYGVKPREVEVPETYRPAMCETVYTEGPQGEVQVWRYNWDSSG